MKFYVFIFFIFYSGNLFGSYFDEEEFFGLLNKQVNTGEVQYMDGVPLFIYYLSFSDNIDDNIVLELLGEKGFLSYYFPYAYGICQYGSNASIKYFVDLSVKLVKDYSSSDKVRCLNKIADRLMFDSYLVFYFGMMSNDERERFKETLLAHIRGMRGKYLEMLN